MEYRHQPVMLKEVLRVLEPRPGQRFADATLGGGGYTMALAEEIKDRGKILALDMDPWAIENAERTVEEKGLKNVTIVRSNFKNIKEVSERYSGKDVRFHGIVFDLGLSLAQLEDEDRGFSFKRDTPLDMSFEGEDKKGEKSRAGYIVNHYGFNELCAVFKELGEEKLSPRIAKNVIARRAERPIVTTKELERAVEEAIPKRFFLYRNNIKARIFQSLRIKVNRELENLEAALPRATELLISGGRIVVVSYHSLEDRRVKNYFKQESKDCLCPSRNWECVCGHRASLEILTKKPLLPSRREVEVNPRARSAKLRAAEKL